MEEAMVRLLAPFIFCFLILCCQKITNNINDIEFECGGTADLSEFRYVKLFSEAGAIHNPDGLLVKDEKGNELPQLVTPKGCLKVPKQFENKLLIARPSANEGIVFYPQRLALGSVQSHMLQSYRYKALVSSCQGAIVTSARQMTWPLDWVGLESAAYDWHLTIKKGADVRMSLQRNAEEDLEQEWIDVSNLEDGSYHMTIQAQQLFSKDKQETRFDCQLIVDRASPLVTLDRGLIRLDDGTDPSIQAAPGEAIRIQTIGSTSVDTVYACLIEESTHTAPCSFDPLTSGYVTAPQRGSWILRLKAKDQAGNEGPILERRLQIFDNNLVATIRAFVDQSVFAQKSGAFIQSMILSVRSYEKMRTLGSKVELQSVYSHVRRSMLESITMAVEELIVKHAQNQISLSVGLPRLEGKTHYLLGEGWHKLDFLEMTGRKKTTLDLSEVLGAAKDKVKYHYCDAQQEIVAVGGGSLVVVKDTLPKPIIALADAVESSLLGVTAECQYAIVDTQNRDFKRKRVIVDLRNGETSPVPSEAYYAVASWKKAEPRKLIVESLFSNYFILDLANNSLQKLEDVLTLPEIRKVHRAKDGSTGVLTKDQVLHIFDAEGQIVTQLANVLSFEAGLLKDEFVVFANGQDVKIVGSDGKVRMNLYVGQTSWSYLNANREFVVAMSAGSNLVKVWTRAGNNYDEIYNKGDSIRKVMLSEEGYLLVESSQYHKVFRLKNELTQKHAPQFVHAVGLQFSGDGQNLVYKGQQPGWDSGHIVSNNLVQWDWSKDQKSFYPIPEVPVSSSTSYPGYGSQSRDLQHFMENGKEYLAMTVKRGNIAIYQADKLDAAIEEYELTSNWLLDIALDPSGELLAAASQNGLVFIVGRKNGVFGTKSLTDIYPQYFEEYPVTLQFDRTGKHLFVTDLNRNLMKFALNYNENSQSYELTLVNKVSEAGVNLAIHAKSETLAVVGQGAKLKLFNADLELLKEYDLSSSSITLGQSVSFSPDGSKIYAGVYDGTWNELDRKTGQLLKVRFSSNETGATNLVVAPQGDRIAFMGGGFVQVADLNVDRVYQNICSWLRPRLPHIPDLSEDDRKLCAAQP
jgi:WD40 repeat protein